jgi:hypothetical protein
MTSRKRQAWWMALACAILLLPVAALLGGPAAGAPAHVPSYDLPAANANSLWTYITRQSPYTSWKPFPGVDKQPLQLTEEPHGAWVAAYANDIAVRSMTNPLTPFTMQYGSIIVKENYAPSPTPPERKAMMSLTVMYKVDGYHNLPGEEEWYWVMYTPGGQVQTVANQPWAQQKDWKPFKGEVQAGKPWLCVSCHQYAAQPSKQGVGDYIYKLKAFLPAK